MILNFAWKSIILIWAIKNIQSFEFHFIKCVSIRIRRCILGADIFYIKN